MADVDEGMTRELLASRVIARLVALRHAGALAHADAAILVHRLDADARTLATMLWDWALAIDATQRLILDVFAPARDEPGRLHRRVASESHGRPRGTVHWPRTSQLALARGQSCPLEFHCTVAERSVLAPENLLLVWTLDDALAHTLASFDRVESSALLAADDRLLVRRFRSEAELALRMPWARHCRAALAPLRARGRRAERELERAVDERVRGRPSAAPEWARSLLDLRRMRTRVLGNAHLRELDVALLWTQLAWLELVASLRGTLRLRYVHASKQLADACGHVLEPIPGSTSWVLAGQHPLLGWSSTCTPDWQQVRCEAALACLELRHREREIDRWLVFHHARDSPEIDVVRHGSIELVLCRLDPMQASPPALAETLAGWLR